MTQRNPKRGLVPVGSGPVIEGDLAGYYRRFVRRFASIVWFRDY